MYYCNGVISKSSQHHLHCSSSNSLVVYLNQEQLGCLCELYFLLDLHTAVIGTLSSSFTSFCVAIDGMLDMLSITESLVINDDYIFFLDHSVGQNASIASFCWTWATNVH